MEMNKTILITGANAGIGKETARQLGLKKETLKIILAGRNLAKLKTAKKELEQQTNRDIFEILIIDVSDIQSVKKAVESMKQPIDAIIMNAGGMGGKSPGALTKDGVTHLFAVNVLGHALFLQELLERKLLSNMALFAGSEAIVGVPYMGMKRPKLATSSVEDFVSISDGSHYGKNFDPNQAYGGTKYLGVMWLASVARKYPNMKFVSISPGSTKGTEVANDMPKAQQFLMKHVMMGFLLPLFGLAHDVEKAAKRFVDGVSSDSFKSGRIYASRKNKLTGNLTDQAELFKDLENIGFQDNAYAAVQKLIRP
jgi:NAD(P)-dependent dehydrogenase (short-subunit alcohol dehydrogenase family)